MVMIARAQLSMKTHMKTKRSGTNGQPLSDGFMRRWITQVSHSAKIKLVPVSVV